MDQAARPCTDGVPREGRPFPPSVCPVFAFGPSRLRTLSPHTRLIRLHPYILSIKDSLPLKLVRVLAGVTDDSDSEPCQMAFARPRRQKHSELRRCIFIDLHIPNNLMPVTSDSITWRGRLDGANEIVSKMDDVSCDTTPTSRCRRGISLSGQAFEDFSYFFFLIFK